MNKVNHEYNPLSIDEQVKKKLEKRASGVLGSEPRLAQAGANKFLMPSASNWGHDTNTDLPTQFINLLFPTDLTTQRNPASENEVGNPNKETEKTGTNPVFFALKEQEESSCNNAKEDGPFSLVIQNTQLGELKLNGTWANGTLKVQLQMPKPLDAQQRQVLTAILQKKLSHELGVQTEIEID